MLQIWEDSVQKVLIGLGVDNIEDEIEFVDTLVKQYYTDNPETPVLWYLCLPTN